MKELVKLWKEAGISSVSGNYHCGGDDFGGVEFTAFDSAGAEIPVTSELQEELEESMFSNLSFAVNSDGYYQGESGAVEVVLEEQEGEEDDGTDPVFLWSKDATYEYSERQEFVDKSDGFMFPLLSQMFHTKIDSFTDYWIYFKDGHSEKTLLEEESEEIERFRNLAEEKTDEIVLHEDYDGGDINYEVGYCDETDSILITYDYYTIVFSSR